MAARTLGIALVGIGLGVLPCSRAAEASAPSTRTMTLGEALAYAHAHQPDLKAAAARIDVARAAADATRARWYPTLTGAVEVLATTTNNTTGSYLAVAGLDNPRVSSTLARSASTSSLEPAASSLVGLGLRQEVYDFGRITAQAAADDLRADATLLSAKAITLVVDDNIEEAYFAVYATQAVVDASESAFLRARVHRDQAKAGLDAGLRRPIELTRAEAVLDRYDLGRIRAAHSVVVAEAVLAAAVGVPDRRLGISVIPPSPTALPSLDRAFALAEQNPDLRSALLRIQAQEKQTRAIAAETRPNLLVSGTVSGNAGGADPSSGNGAEAHGLLPVVPNWDLGLVLSWPLLDETVRARKRQSLAQEQVDRDEADGVHQRLVAEVEEAYADVEAARDALPVQRRALEAAVANYEQASARFNAGVGNAIEMADAEELRTSAEIEVAQGTFEVARARARLGRFLAEAT